MDRTVKQPKFIDEQIIGGLREQEAGLTRAEVCRRQTEAPAPALDG